MTQSTTLTLTVRVSWWVRPYIAGVALCARLTGASLDLDKLKRTVLHGIRVEI